MRSEFELKSIKLLTERLLEDGYIKNVEQRDKLYEVYSNDNREFYVIHEEIKKLRFDKELLEKKLKMNEQVLNKESNTVDLKKQTEVPLSLENITDFEKNGKMFIKIHYPKPLDSVRIIENNTDPYKSGKEIFESLRETQKIISLDGEKNTTSLFEQVLLRDCAEVKLRDIKEVSVPTEYSKLSYEEKQVVYGTLKCIISSLNVSDDVKTNLNEESIDTMLRLIDKKIYISPEYNIIVTCTPNEPSKDSVKELKYILESGVKKFYLSSISENAYDYSKEEYTESVQEQNTEYEKTQEEDMIQEKGTQYKPVPPWKKRRNNNQAAFISIFWITLFAGVLVGIISFLVTFVFMNK